MSDDDPDWLAVPADLAAASDRSLDGPADTTLRIVVGVDGSDTSWRAAAYAVGAARRQGGQAWLVFVYVAPVAGVAAFTPEVVAAALTSSHQTYAQIAQTLERGLQDLPARWELRGRTGSAFGELVRVATELRADMVVVGASSRIGHRVAGSVAARLVKVRRWPVVVVP
jgi:nucleotide-binding universal stress UspA family protein